MDSAKNFGRMKVFSNIDHIRKCRWVDPYATWGLVPTMGYLHEGHLSLVRRGKAENDRVGVSIFVNPIQFNNGDDLNKYPRDLERDLDMLAREGVDLVWTPTPEMVYPPGFQTYTDVEQITRKLEGASRPGHFKGVTTVVAKLFNIFQPHKAYFGQKDAQQALVITRMAEDLNFNAEVVTCGTVREPDGLAMSSRNARLSPEARSQAACLYGALTSARGAVASGERDVKVLKSIIRDVIEANNTMQVEYVSVADAESLRELEDINRRALISLAVFIDGVRLIDNIVVEPAPRSRVHSRPLGHGHNLYAASP
jgi:pantoate--beta-alanine ligase